MGHPNRKALHRGGPVGDRGSRLRLRKAAPNSYGKQKTGPSARNGNTSKTVLQAVPLGRDSERASVGL